MHPVIIQYNSQDLVNGSNLGVVQVQIGKKNVYKAVKEKFHRKCKYKCVIMCVRMCETLHMDKAPG